MTSIDEIIANTTAVERTVHVCVAGALSGEAEELRERIDAHRQATEPGRLSGPATLQDLERQLTDVLSAMQDYTYAFRFRAISPKRWSDLMSSHADKAGTRMFNPETFPAAAIQATCFEPEGMEDPERAQGLLDKLSPAQQADLFDAAWNVNVTSPKGGTSFPA